MVLLDEQPHDVIISPLTTVKLLSVKLSTMRHWLWTYPEFNQQFMPYLAKKMREEEQLASSLILHDVPTRLSRIILEHINKIKFYTGTKEEEHQHHLVNGLNDETLARMTGSVRQVINKQLQLWKKEDTSGDKSNYTKREDRLPCSKSCKASRMESSSLIKVGKAVRRNSSSLLSWREDWKRRLGSVATTSNSNIF